MRKLALDLGDARIGVAVSDPSGTIAGGQETYERRGDECDFSYIAGKIETLDCDTVVVGLPLNMDGTEGDRVAVTRAFADKLSEYTSAKIVFQDERWTTVSAEKMLINSGVRRKDRKKVVDKVAAAIILQTYLDKING